MRITYLMLGRVICTCYAGYRFNQNLHRQSSQRTSESFHLNSPSSSFNQSDENASSVGIINSCEDIDECASDNADCEQVDTVINHSVQNVRTILLL